MEPKTNMTEMLQNDSTLHIVASSIVNKFTNLYNDLEKLKQKAVDEKQTSQLIHVEDKIDSLATKTLSQSQDLRNTMKRTKVEWEIENLRQQLELLQKRHDDLEERHQDLEKRVTELECTMVTREQFQDLKHSCQQRFSLFDNRFKVLQDQNYKFYLSVDDQFKRRIKPSDQFKQKLSELMKTNHRMFEYTKKMYWTLINQILAYRALSSGMVQKGSMKKNFQESTLFKEVVGVVSSATFLIAGIPIAGGVFLVVKDLASIFFRKKQEIVVNNMCLRVQGYFTEDQIAQDVARAVLELINNPNIQIRLAQFKTRSMIMSALCKFFQFIATAEFSPELLADMFASKLGKMKKEKEAGNDYLMENVITDTSLIMWKMAESQPAEKRYAVSGAVKFLFNKNLPPQKPMQGNQNMNSSAMNGPSPLINYSDPNKGCGIQNNSMLASSPSLDRNFIFEDNTQHMVAVQENKNMVDSLPPTDNQINQSKASVASQGSTLVSNSQFSHQGNGPLNNLTNIPPENINMPFNSYQVNNTPNLQQANQIKSLSSQRSPYFKLKLLRSDIGDRKQFFNTKLTLYCVVKYRDRIVRTDPIKTADLKPIWNAEYIFETSEIPSAITIEVYDRERVFKDEFIGAATLLDTQLDHREQEVPIWSQGKMTGKLIVVLQP